MSAASPSSSLASGKGTVLVTGAAGFTGMYLLPALTSAGYATCGLGTAPGPRVDVVADVTDLAGLKAAVSSVAPRYVIHLAAISFVPHAETNALYRINVVGATNLLEACADLPDMPEKVILASSANVYGIPRTVEPLHENLCPAPVNHYGASKLAMECLARTWFDRLPILITRPFNYTGVGQDPRFVLPKIVNAFRARAPTLELGDTNVVRDFSDVRDVAEIYARLMESETAGEVVNVCSATGASIASAIEFLAVETKHMPEIRVGQHLLRATEIPALVGSERKLSQSIGRMRRRQFVDTLRWMLRKR